MVSGLVSISLEKSSPVQIEAAQRFTVPLSKNGYYRLLEFPHHTKE